MKAWKTEGKRQSTNIPELVTSAFSSISLKSIFTRALVRSQGIVTLSIHITTVCSVQTLIYVWDNKMNIIRMWRLFWLALAARIFVLMWTFPVVKLNKICLISQISFLAPARVWSNGVIACGITVTAMFTRQALVYVCKRKERPFSLSKFVCSCVPIIHSFRSRTRKGK